MTVVAEQDSLDEASLDDAIDEAEDQLGLLFGRVRTVYKDSAIQIHPDLQPVGYKLLAAIVRAGQTTAGALAEAHDTDKSVVSRQVRMLEEAGLVVSQPDDRDGRARVLTPTPIATERVREVRTQQRNNLRERLRTRSQQEIETFTELLRLINQG